MQCQHGTSEACERCSSTASNPTLTRADVARRVIEMWRGVRRTVYSTFSKSDDDWFLKSVTMLFLIVLALIPPGLALEQGSEIGAAQYTDLRRQIQAGHLAQTDIDPCMDDGLVSRWEYHDLQQLAEQRERDLARNLLRRPAEE